jgi:hypothetical protein
MVQYTRRIVYCVNTQPTSTSSPARLRVHLNVRYKVGHVHMTSVNMGVVVNYCKLAFFPTSAKFVYIHLYNTNNVPTFV